MFYVNLKGSLSDIQKGVWIFEKAYNSFKTKTLSVSEPPVLEKRICKTVYSGIICVTFYYCKRFAFDKTYRQLN